MSGARGYVDKEDVTSRKTFTAAVCIASGVHCLAGRSQSWTCVLVCGG